MILRGHAVCPVVTGSIDFTSFPFTAFRNLSGRASGDVRTTGASRTASGVRPEVIVAASLSHTWTFLIVQLLTISPAINPRELI